MKNYIENIELKKKELVDAENEFKYALKVLCTQIISKHIYNRKFKKCISYCLYKKYKGYLRQQDIADILVINRTDVVIAITDVERWLKINNCEVIKYYTENINSYI